MWQVPLMGENRACYTSDEKSGWGHQGNLLLRHKIGYWLDLGPALSTERMCWSMFSNFKDEDKTWEEGWWNVNRKVNGWQHWAGPSWQALPWNEISEISRSCCICLLPTGKGQCRNHRWIHQKRKEGQVQCLQKRHFSQIQQLAAYSIQHWKKALFPWLC